jgi:HAE1 family hydrophobic/amphiphilic exporter-1
VVTTQGAFRDPQAILEAPVSSAPGGRVVRIADVATVDVMAMAEKRSHASLDGAGAVALVVQKESGANTVEVANAVRAELLALEQDLAAQGVKLVITNDSAPFIERSFHEVQFDLILGGFLAVLIIMVFLRDWRATFISALALPTSVIATVWFLSILDFTFNQMTMLALSLSIGLLIDDAIVVIENIHRHLEKGEPPLKAAASGTAEIGLAVMATTLSIVAVFAPVATMQGLIGRFFFQFGLTVSIAVLVSLFVSLTLTPMLASRMLKAHHGRPNILARAIERVLDVVDRVYRRTLGWVLHARWSMALTMVIAVLLMAGSCGLAGQVKQEFAPDEDRSQFTIDVELPTGTSLPTSTAVIEALATDVRATAPQVTNTFVTIGQGAQGQVNIGKIQVNMVGPSQRDFTQQDLMNWARERYTPLTSRGLKITINQISGVGGDDGFKSQAVQFALRSNDMAKLIAAAEALTAELAKNPGFVDLDMSYRSGKPQLEIIPDRHAAAAVGVSVAPIATTLRALVARDKITDYKDGVELYDVKLTLPPEVQSQLATLSNLTVRSPAGDLVPLDTLVKVEEGVGPSQIDRQDKQRQIMIYANLDGLVLGEATRLVEEAAARVVPKEVDTQMSGMGEIMEESFGYMVVALLLAIVLLYMILAAQFESLIHPFTIMMSLPLSVVGAFSGLYLTGQNMSIFAMIGLIMLMGLVTKNAILLVDYTNQKKREGLSTHDALLAAGPVRLRPILMTTAAMILGMLPVALALGEGGGTRAPMAVVVIGGLITSTLLTLLVIPIIYTFFEWLRTRFRRRPAPQKLSE